MFRITLPITVDRLEGELSVAVEADISLFYRSGRWQAQCVNPPVTSGMCESIEESLVTIAKEIATDEPANTA